MSMAQRNAKKKRQILHPSSKHLVGSSTKIKLGTGKIINITGNFISLGNPST